MAVEDQCLHAAFEGMLGLTNSPVSLLRHEQKELRERLAALRTALPAEVESRARAFFSALDHHCQKEQSAVWPFINNALPDHLAPYPAHYSGSVCGRGLSANPVSTVGFERRHNPALSFDSEDAFVAALTSDIPPAPEGQAAIVAANRSGRPSAIA